MTNILFADAHNRDRRGDEFYALQQIAKLAIRKKAEWVIGAGDLIDKQTNRSYPISTFRTVIDELHDHGIQFGFIEGQHEADDPPWLRGPGSTCLHKKKIKLGDYTAYGLSFQPFGALQDALAEIPDDCDMLICHQVWADWMGDIASPQGDFSQIPEHIKLVVTGDLHQFKLERHKNAGGVRMQVCSPGATVAQKIDEPHQNFVMLLDGSTLTSHQLQSRPFIDWPVMNRSDDVEQFMREIEAELSSAEQKALAAELPDHMIKPLLRITYSSKLDDAVRRITKAVGQRAYLHWAMRQSEEKIAERTKRKKNKGEALTPITALPLEVDKEDDPEVFSLVSRLLEAQDVSSEFYSFKKEALDGE